VRVGLDLSLYSQEFAEKKKKISLGFDSSSVVYDSKPCIEGKKRLQIGCILPLACKNGFFWF
jgi:hypothetical protein